MIDKLSPLYARGIKPIPVIPTVYTDALSYGEQVGVMTKKIDECVDKVNEVVDDNNEFKTDLTEQQDTFETNITNQQDTFETNISEQQNTFETNITNQQNTYEENTTAGLNTWKTETKAEYKAQIDGMEDEWDNFLEEYETIGDVTQNPYGENTLVVTSQKAVNDGLKRFNGIGNLLFNATPYYNYYNRGTQAPQSSNSYSYFDIELTANTTYYFNGLARFVASSGTLISEDVSSFTPTDTGTYYLTFYNKDEWKVSTTNDFSNISGFKSPSLSENQLKQELGEDKSLPMSQGAINTEFNNKNGIAINNNLGSDNHFNLVYNASKIVYNHFNNGSAIDAESTNYSIVELHLISGYTYYFHKAARFILWNGAKVAEDVESYTAEHTGTHRITLYNTGYQNSLMIIATTDNFDNVPPFSAPCFTAKNLAQTMGNSTKIPMSQKAVSDMIIAQNILSGKKYVACGDSFTVNNGQNDHFTDEPYSGELKMYPYFVGRLFGMNVSVLGAGGMKMGHIDGSTNDFSTSLYQSIPNDADYITLKFGINDDNYNTPIGTINDNTNETYYGAWNVVMSYIIANHPTAKIGIIISNGIDYGSGYGEATIAIAKKYGVPYLNEYNGEQVPLLIRSARQDVDASIIQIRNETFRVSSENTHPNSICQEYEAKFLGEWLKTL